MRNLFVFLLLLMNMSTFAQTGVQDKDWLKVKGLDFDSLLNNANLNFSIPEHFSETSLIENESVLYQKAYSHDSSGFEIRIWIRDLRTVNPPNGLTVDQFSKSYITMLSLNASGYILPNMPNVTVFNTYTSNSEFNADWVASTAFLPKENRFNKGFEVCSIIGMRKNEIAEVYVFFMISNKDEEMYLVKNLAQVVTFTTDK